MGKLSSICEEGLNIIRPRLPGKMLFFKVWGSWSHNTQMPESDIDYLAVYECHPLDLQSLRAPSETVDGKGPDFQAHELGKFCRLLLKGNPGIVECLFTEQGYAGSKAWDSLRKMRSAFLNQTTLKSYLGYCNGQLRRLANGSRLHTSAGEYNTKWAYHLIRLAYDAERIAQGQEPLVFKPADSNEHNLLMDIRQGKYSPEEIKRLFNNIDERIKTYSAIPKGPPLDELSKWLVEERHRTFLVD